VDTRTDAAAAASIQNGKGRERERISAKKPNDGRQARINTFHTYPAPNAQWSRSIALDSLLDSAHVNVSPKKRSGLKANLLSRGRPCQQPSFEMRSEGGWHLRVRILLLVVMDFVAIENDSRVLRNVHPIVYKVFCRVVRRRQPKWRMCALRLRK
jgi:hypothetical protein